MNRRMNKLRFCLLPLVLALLLFAGCGPAAVPHPEETEPSYQDTLPPEEHDTAAPEDGYAVSDPQATDDYTSTEDQIVFGAYYTVPEEVAEYLHTYDELLDTLAQAAMENPLFHFTVEERGF